MSLTSTNGDLILRIASAMANCGAVLTFCLSTRSFLTAQHVDTEPSMALYVLYRCSPFPWNASLRSCARDVCVGGGGVV